ncbi:CSLREA domain-containing protein [Acinetobacter baumannii]
MKNYKKALLALSILATMPLFADSTNKRIEVTTFADEDGENPNACSLREAIKVAATRKSDYGCTIFSLDDNQAIQLKAGTYTLNKELVPNANISIYGYGVNNNEQIWTEKDPLTNNYPALPELKTRINAAGKSRIFNTAENKKTLTLQNIILENGVTSTQGGAIYAGGNVTLLDSQILNSQASKGGAIFLGGTGVNLSISHSLLQGNQAVTGSVLAMSCKEEPDYAKRDITITSSSIFKNGSLNSKSTFEFCGEPNAILSINTIAKNIADKINGSILKFTGDAVPGSTTNPSTILSGSSSLNLQNNTIVENTAHSTFLYDSLGVKELRFNLIGYNLGSYACRYLLGPATDLKNSGFTLSFNALNLTNNIEKCDLPTEALTSSNKTIDIANIPFSSLLEPQSSASPETGFLPVYYPLNNTSSPQNDLIDVDPDGNAKYRAIYIDLKAKGLPLPNEGANHTLKFFNTTDYNINVETIGTGLIDDKVYNIKDKEENILKCEWNSALQSIIFYRLDDRITQAGDYNYCKYTVSTKDGSIQSTGLLEARFDNIAPVATDETVSFKYLANEIIPINLLKYANDDGDGPANTLQTKPNKPQFWVNDKGVELPIYLPSKSSKDGIFKVVKADREGPCPNNDKDNTCYGGNIYIQASNVFNTFNDTLTYYVYDADGKISNEGTIKLISTATTTDDSRGGGGGGSIGILSIASLLSLIAYRRYRK